MRPISLPTTSLTPRKESKAGSTRGCSQAVPHPSTNRALCRLTSEVRRDPVCSTRYGRQRRHMQPVHLIHPLRAPGHTVMGRQRPPPPACCRRHTVCDCRAQACAAHTHRDAGRTHGGGAGGGAHSGGRSCGGGSGAHTCVGVARPATTPLSTSHSARRHPPNHPRRPACVAAAVGRPAPPLHPCWRVCVWCTPALGARTAMLHPHHPSRTHARQCHTPPRPRCTTTTWPPMAHTSGVMGVGGVPGAKLAAP